MAGPLQSGAVATPAYHTPHTQAHTYMHTHGRKTERGSMRIGGLGGKKGSQQKGEILEGNGREYYNALYAHKKLSKI